MTLEHIPDTGEVYQNGPCLQLSESANAHVFFQVPDVLRVLEDEAFWDIYYEHCSYFSAGSLARLFRTSGFQILEVGHEYNDQYVTVEARSADGTGSPLAAEKNSQKWEARLHRFADHVPKPHH